MHCGCGYLYVICTPCFRCTQLNLQIYQVFVLFVIETANTAFDISYMYQPLILEYGQSYCPMFLRSLIFTQARNPFSFQRVSSIFFLWLSGVPNLRNQSLLLVGDQAIYYCLKFLTISVLLRTFTCRAYFSRWPTILFDTKHQQVAVSTPIQLFFAWRIRSITKSYWIPAIVSILAFAACGAHYTSLQAFLVD